MLIRIPAVLNAEALAEAQAWLADAVWESGAAAGNFLGTYRFGGSTIGFCPPERVCKAPGKRHRWTSLTI